MTHEIDQETREQFQKLAAEWIAPSTANIRSNFHGQIDKPAFHKLVAMGPTIIPLIFEEYQKPDPEWWTLVLQAILGIHPIKETSKGAFEEVRNDWVEWGKLHGYI